MKSHQHSGITTVEVIVAIVVLLLLVSLIAPVFNPPLRSPYLQTLWKMHQFQLALKEMTLEHEKTGAPLRWTCEGTEPTTREKIIRSLVDENFLQESDVHMLLSVEDKWRKRTENGYTLFAVTADDEDSVLMMATKNWSPKSDKLSDDHPRSEKFVVFRKGGTGDFLRADSLSDTKLIGEGGMHGYQPLKDSQ